MKILHKFEGRRELEALLARGAESLEANGGAMALHVEPGDGTRYVVTLTMCDGTLLVGVQCPPSWACEVDPDHRVDPEGLQSLAGRDFGDYPINRVALALVSDLINAVCGHAACVGEYARIRNW